MADSGLNAIEKALRAALNVSGVTSLVAAASHYNMLVPPGAAFPALTFALHHNDATGRAFASDAMALDYVVKGITSPASGADAVADAGDIAQQIDLALDGAALTPTGYHVYRIRRQSWLRYTEYDEGRRPYVHAGGIYRLWIY